MNLIEIHQYQSGKYSIFKEHDEKDFALDELKKKILMNWGISSIFFARLENWATRRGTFNELYQICKKYGYIEENENYKIYVILNDGEMYIYDTLTKEIDIARVEY